MKKKFLLFLLTLISFGSPIWADDPPKPKENPNNPPIVLEPGKPRPHTEDGDPDFDSEILAYVEADGTITLVFPEDMGIVNVELQTFGGATVYRAIHSSSCPIELHVSSAIMPLLIEVTISDGTVYGGILN